MSDGIGVFEKNTGLIFSTDFPQAFVIPSLDSGVVDGGVHDVGFQENDGAVIEPVGEEIASPKIGLAGKSANTGGFRWILISGQAGLFGEYLRDGGSDLEFFLVPALEDFLEQGEALVGEGNLMIVVSAVDEDVHVGVIDERGLVGITPGFGIEMEAEDEVGLECFIDQLGAGVDFGSPVEKALGDFGERFWIRGGFGFESL